MILLKQGTLVSYKRIMSDYKFPTKKDINLTKSKINREFNNQNEYTCCAICGKDIKNISKAFHKSHTVPFFCLENIKGIYNKNTGVLNANYAAQRNRFSDKEFYGTNKAGVFYSICSNCDQTIFNIYESEEALLTLSSKELVNVIAIKTYLKELFDCKFKHFKTTLNYSELSEDELLIKYFNNMNSIEKSVISVDLKDFQEDLEYAKRCHQKDYSNYRILHHSILDYTVPVAAQVSIPISKNVDYSKLQDVTLTNKNRLENIIVCIFPLKKKSVIIVFTRIDNKLIKKYNKQFKKLSDEEKLKEIFYLLIRYKLANYYFSPLVKDILTDDAIRSIYSIEDSEIDLGKFSINMSDCEELSWKQNLPSILSEEYSIEKLKTK